MSNATEPANRNGTGGFDTRKFSSIAHIRTPQALHEAFRGLRKDASAGVDEVTYQDYEKQANENIPTLWEKLTLWERLKSRALPCAAAAQDLDSEGGREAESDLDPVPGRQDRAEGHGETAQCDLRVGFSPLLRRIFSPAPTGLGRDASRTKRRMSLLDHWFLRVRGIFAAACCSHESVDVWQRFGCCAQCLSSAL